MLAKRGAPPVLGFLVGVVFGGLLAAYLFITGILDVSVSSNDTRSLLTQALPRVAKDLVPWLLIWWFVTPAIQRIRFGQPWLALLSSAGLGVALVPALLHIENLSWTQLGAVFLFGLVLTLPIVRAKDVWLPTAFFIGLHIVTVTIIGAPFGGLGEGILSARLVGDELITGGQLGPVFGFAGILGLLWLAASVLRHQKLLFAGAPDRFQPRGQGLRQMAIGLCLAAAGVAVMFVLTLGTGQSRIAGVDLSIGAITDSLTTALPIAIASAVLSCLFLVSAVHALIPRGWIAAIVATIVTVVVHLQAPGTNAHTAAGVAALTLAATLAFARTGRLWMPVGLLYGWLLFEGPIFGFPTNGFPIGHPWFQQQVIDYTVLGGGIIGPAASAFATGGKLMLVAAVFFVTRTDKSRGA